MTRLSEILDRGNSARSRGAIQEAVEAYKEAIAASPSASEPKNALARIFIDTKGWEYAEELCRDVLNRESKNVEARYTLASARLEQGFPEEAEFILTELIRENKTQGAIHFVRARANLALGNLAASEEDLTIAFNKTPSQLTLKTLANLYWMTGNTSAFSQLLTFANSQGGLAIFAADVLRESGDLDLAEKRCLALPSQLRDHPETQFILSLIYQDQGNGEAARVSAQRAVEANPDRNDMVDALICAQLMQGDGHSALKTLQRWRTKEPEKQHWIAHEAVALRLLGDTRYRELVRYDDHVKAYPLPAPEGFKTIEEFNQAFLRVLEKYRIFKKHPLDQSLRDGIQTPRGLYSIKDSVIQAYFKALETPIKSYLADIGQDRTHPTTARNTGKFKFNGSWSVKLHSGGKHVNHVHSEGWISSSYYVDVPYETLEGKSKAGWIKFGEPPFKTNPTAPPEKWIQPKAGMLVLFPSYLWHGTEPILDGSSRVTAPFDLVPA